MSDPYGDLRTALQHLLNCEGEGWILTDYVAVVGLQRLNPSGVVESTAWPISPRDQPDYITDGLLAAAEDIRARCSYTTDEDFQ